MRMVPVLAVILLLGAAVASCSKHEAAPVPAPGTPVIEDGDAMPTSPPAPLTPADPRALMTRAELASVASAYTIDVDSTNFVLPQWGGSDSGTVTVGRNGSVARAELRRTGEDGSYTILFVDGQTFFKRSTCASWARIPGGGASVLEPFIVRQGDINRGTYAGTSQTAPEATVEANVVGVGAATLVVDTTTGRPKSLVSNPGGAHTAWDFYDWGKEPDVRKPTGDIPDRGPGGNPC